ncbi:hypothetical protein [Nitrosophilus alvini]|uniref:hypothetical protein n=1 Tax=Nitrosophilus alvini TaxID=2714855 RepID=UPI00190AFF81|nr:hypothetical protein [Nitrosophilus alvini]
MKKIVLSMAAAALTAGSLSAGAITLYQDKDTGAIYTKPGPNRVELGDFISAKEVYIQNETIKSKMAKALKGTTVKSKVKTLKFSGKHYLGFTSINYDDNRDSINRFETRRNYLQVKAYWNKKDYARITLDTFQQYKDTGSKDDGSWLVRLKYAYIYLDNILPYTGVEFGQAHRPWIDWEEHHGWWYRSINKVFVEDKYMGAHMTNSADIGFNLKTKTEYFSSEVGLFNGEGYHDASTEENQQLSFEWRLTANLLGTGKEKVHMDDEYADISFFGQVNPEYKNNVKDFKWYGIHGVYNRPLFLVAAQYVKSDYEGDGAYEGNGWSVNGEFRPVKKWSILGRYDNWNVENDDPAVKDYTRKGYIAGVAYKYNKNVKFIGNITHVDNRDPAYFAKYNHYNKYNQYMFTAEVNW